MVLKSSSGRRSTMRPRSCASEYGSSMAKMESATRGSRRVFFALSDPSLVPIRMRSPSRATQMGADWGDPSGIRVARWAKFGRSRRLLISSVSASGMAMLPFEPWAYEGRRRSRRLREVESVEHVVGGGIPRGERRQTPAPFYELEDRGVIVARRVHDSPLRPRRDDQRGHASARAPAVRD